MHRELRTGRVWLATLVVGPGLIAILCWLLVPPVPEVGGRKVGDWLDELMRPDSRRKTEALTAFEVMGEAAAPILIRAFEDRNSPVEELVPRWGVRVPILRPWLKPDADRRSAALEAIERIGTVSALPALIRFVKAVPPSQSDKALRIQALGVIGGMKGKAASAVPALEEIIRAEAARGGSLSRAALKAINDIGGQPEQVGPLLLECLKSADPQIRRLAAAGLGQFGENAAFAVESLTEALWQPDSDAFTQVATALGQVGSAARGSAPALIRGLSHESAMVRAVAARNLSRVRPEGEFAVLSLAEALKDEDPFVRLQTALALGQFGAGASSAVPHLARALHDDNEAVQISVIEALGAIGPNAIRAVPVLEQARRNRQAGLGTFVVAALERIGVEHGVVMLPLGRPQELP